MEILKIVKFLLFRKKSKTGVGLKHTSITLYTIFIFLTASFYGETGAFLISRIMSENSSPLNVNSDLSGEE